MQLEEKHLITDKDQHEKHRESCRVKYRCTPSPDIHLRVATTAHMLWINCQTSTICHRGRPSALQGFRGGIKPRREPLACSSELCSKSKTTAGAVAGGAQAQSWYCPGAGLRRIRPRLTPGKRCAAPAAVSCLHWVTCTTAPACMSPAAAKDYSPAPKPPRNAWQSFSTYRIAALMLPSTSSCSRIIGELPSSFCCQKSSEQHGIDCT